MRSFIFTTIVTALFFTSFSWAQSSAEARAILDKASQLYEKSEGVKISFVLKTDDTDNSIYEPQNGEAFAKGNKFKLELPYATTWFDGKTQWVLLKDANEVNVSNPSTDELAAISPLALLNMYKTGYVLKDPRSRTIKGEDVFEIEMSPTNNTQDIKTISI